MDSISDTLSKRYRKVANKRTRTAQDAIDYQAALAAAKEASKLAFPAYGLPSDIAAEREAAQLERSVPTFDTLSRASETEAAIATGVERVRDRIADFCVMAVMTAGESKLDSARQMTEPYPGIVPDTQWQAWAVDLRSKNYIVAFEPSARPKVMCMRALPV